MTILSPQGTVSILVNTGVLKRKQKHAFMVKLLNDENLISSPHFIISVSSRQVGRKKKTIETAGKYFVNFNQTEDAKELQRNICKQ